MLAITALLVIGIRESARFNATMVAIKLAAVLFFLVAGFKFVKPENWSPFAPYGWSGIMAAGAVVFFAYIGFDAVSTTAEEAKNPSRDLPIGIIASLVICTVLYIAVAAVLTGIVPVTYYRSVEGALPGTAIAPLAESTAFLNAPVAYVLHVIDQDWAAGLISAGAVAGITSVLLVMLMGQPRIFFSMSRDRLLPEGVSKVHPRFGTPYITTIITGRRRRLLCRHHPDRRRRGDDVDRHAVRLRGRVLRRHHAAHQAARGPPAVQGALRLPLPRPRRPLVPLPDAEPQRGHLGALPRLARPRDDDLLVLRADPQPAGRQARSRPPRAAPSGPGTS